MCLQLAVALPARRMSPRYHIVEVVVVDACFLCFGFECWLVRGLELHPPYGEVRWLRPV